MVRGAFPRFCWCRGPRSWCRGMGGVSGLWHPCHRCSTARLWPRCWEHLALCSVGQGGDSGGAPGVHAVEPGSGSHHVLGGPPRAKQVAIRAPVPWPCGVSGAPQGHAGVGQNPEARRLALRSPESLPVDAQRGHTGPVPWALGRGAASMLALGLERNVRDRGGPQAGWVSGDPSGPSLWLCLDAPSYGFTHCGCPAPYPCPRPGGQLVDTRDGFLVPWKREAIPDQCAPGVSGAKEQCSTCVPRISQG